VNTITNKIRIVHASSTLDISELRLDVIKKMSVDSGSFDELIYSPPIIPDREKLEEAFTLFINQEGSWISSLCIGHPNWLNHRHEFQLSFKFCQMLVDKMININYLELYNVQDCHDELKAYLETQKTKFSEKPPPMIILQNEEPKADDVNMDQG